MAREIQKKRGKQVIAYELGQHSEMEIWLIGEGKIIKENGKYYFRSTKMVNPESDATGKVMGQEAKDGDFFKVDNEGNPYPSEREWFLANHRLVNSGANIWEQIDVCTSGGLDS